LQRHRYVPDFFLYFIQGPPQEGQITRFLTLSSKLALSTLHLVSKRIPPQRLILVCIPPCRQLKKQKPFPARYFCRAVLMLPLHFMIFHWRHNVRFSLYTFGCVAGHIFFDCLKKVF